MSVNAIGSSISSASGVSSSSSTAITDATKKKLEALGIDTSKIKTEAEGQQKLKEAQASQASQASQAAQGPQSKQQQSAASQMEEITDQVTTLAAEVGVTISSNDQLSDVMNSISARISEMTVQAGQDTQKLQIVSLYQNELSAISGEYQSFQAQQQATQSSQSQLAGGMDSLASYNKIFHNL